MLISLNSSYHESSSALSYAVKVLELVDDADRYTVLCQRQRRDEADWTSTNLKKMCSVERNDLTHDRTHDEDVDIRRCHC